MFRQSLLFLSDNSVAQHLVTRTPISRAIAHRFVAGETLEEAIRCARTLNEHRLSVSLDFLGESVTSRDEAEAAADMAIRTLEAIAEEGLEANISLKPTQLGLDIDAEFCRANVERVLQRARELGDGEGEIFVRLDMESSEYTERTVALVETLWGDGYHNVGTVLQSYLRRTPDDIERLNGARLADAAGEGRLQGAASGRLPRQGRGGPMFVEEMKMLLRRGPLPRHRDARRGDDRRDAPVRLRARGSREGFLRVPDAVRHPPRPPDATARGGVQRARLRPLRRLLVPVPDAPDGGAPGEPLLHRREHPEGVADGRARAAQAAVGAGIVAGALAALALRRRRSSRRWPTESSTGSRMPNPHTHLSRWRCGCRTSAERTPSSW